MASSPLSLPPPSLPSLPELSVSSRENATTSRQEAWAVNFPHIGQG